MQYEISTEIARFDIGMIHEFLRASYWAKNIPRRTVEKAMANSLCFGAFANGRQIAFARAITDRATFAYLADVFVLPEHRGKGVSELLMSAIMEHPDLHGLRRLLLATKDAHGLYAKFGFQPLSNPESFMTIHRPDVYTVFAKSSLSH